MEFQIGDVVMLNSGGPLMTVSWSGDVDFGHSKVYSVQCTWFDQNQRDLKRETFIPKLLKKVER